MEETRSRKTTTSSTTPNLGHPSLYSSDLRASRDPRRRGVGGGLGSVLSFPSVGLRLLVSKSSLVYLFLECRHGRDHPEYFPLPFPRRRSKKVNVLP